MGTLPIIITIIARCHASKKKAASPCEEPSQSGRRRLSLQPAASGVSAACPVLSEWSGQMQLCSGLSELELPGALLETVASGRLLSPGCLSPWPGGVAGVQPRVWALEGLGSPLHAPPYFSASQSADPEGQLWPGWPQEQVGRAAERPAGQCSLQRPGSPGPQLDLHTPGAPRLKGPF